MPGAYTVGQSQASALVYGMPRVAFEEGAVVEQAPVEAIAGRLAACADAAQVRGLTFARCKSD